MPISRIGRGIASLLAAAALVISGVALTPGVASAATTNYYFAIANGAWNAAPGSGVWRTCTNAAGTAGCTTIGVTAPTTVANIVTIKTGVALHVSSAVTADQVVVAAGGQLIVDAGATLTINNGGGADLTVSGAASISGTLAYAGGAALNISGTLSTTPDGRISGGSAASVVTVKTGGGLTIAQGSTYAVAGTGAARLDINAGGAASIDGAVSGIPNMAMNGTLTASVSMAMTGAVTSQVQIGGSFTMTAGTLTTSRGNGGYTIQVKNLGTLALTGSSSATVGTAATAHLDVLSGGTLDLGPGAFISGTGLVAVSSGATLKVGDPNGINMGTSAASGNVRTSGLDTYNAGAKYQYTGSAPQVTGASLPTAAVGGSVTIANAAGVTPTGNLLANGTGKVVVASGGNLRLLPSGPGSLVSGTGTFQLDAGGMLQVGSAAGITSSGATGNVQTTTRSYSIAANYAYNGSAAQATGSGLPLTVNSLTINNVAGVSLTRPVTLTGGGTVTSGAFNLDANNVTVSGSSSLAVTSTGSISRTTGYVLGNLQKTVATGNPTLTFEVGTAGASTPVMVTFSGVTTGGSLTARATSSDHASLGGSILNPSRSLNSYYTLANSGVAFGTYSATLGFPGTFGPTDGELDTGTATSALGVGRFAGGTWTYPTIGTRTATTTQVTGEAGFGDLAVAEILDTTPPVVTIDSIVPSVINGTGSSVVTWHADESGTFNIRVGGTNCTTGTVVSGPAAYSAPSSRATTINASSLGDGANTVRVCVTDAAANVGQATGSLGKDTLTTVSIATWTHPITSADETSAVISGTSEAGDTIDLTVGDGTPAHDVTRSATADATGDWSFTDLDLSGLDDGTANITYGVLATDAVGNTATDSKLSDKEPSGPSEPTVTLTPPASATLFATETLEATAAYAHPILNVEFLVDGSVIGTDTTAPYSVTFDTTTVTDGPHLVSARVNGTDSHTGSSVEISITVANALPADGRVDVDFEAGVLTPDDHALFGVLSLGAPLELPERYRSTTPAGEGTTSIYGYLSNWDSLSQQTRDEITAFLEQPLRGSLYGAMAPAGRASQRAAPPGITDPCEYVEKWETLPDIFLGSGFKCTHVSAHQHFSIIYTVAGDGVMLADTTSVLPDDLGTDTLHPGCVPGPGCANGVPDSVDKLAWGLDEAYEIYHLALGYPTWWPGQGQIPVQIHGGLSGGQVLPILIGPNATSSVNTIEIPNAALNPYFLAHHELFHVFQFGWAHLPNLAANYATEHGPWAWMEATADWAAGYVARSTDPGAPPLSHVTIGAVEPDANDYANHLPVLLGRPNEKLSSFDKPPDCDMGPRLNCREYGLFLLAEYLTENLIHDSNGQPVYSPGVVREIWEELGQFNIFNLAQDYVPAVETVIGRHPLPGTAAHPDPIPQTLLTVLPGFTYANYLLDYDDSVEPGNPSDVQPVWRDRLVGDPRTEPNTWASGSDVAPARPNRFQYISLFGETLQNTEQVRGKGAAVYVELIPSGDGSQPGSFSVSVTRHSDTVDAHVVSLTYPTTLPAAWAPCSTRSIAFDAQGQGSVSVPVGSTCRYAVLILTGLGDDVAVDWSSTLTSDAFTDFRADAPDLASHLTPNVPFSLSQDLGAFTDIQVSPNYATSANGASASAASGSPGLLIDDDPATFWEGSNEFTIDLGQLRTVDLLHWTQGDYPANASDNTTVCVSVDGATWTCLGQFVSLGTWAGYCGICYHYEFPPVTARYWRFTDNSHLALWRVSTMELGIQAAVDPTDPQIDDPHAVGLDDPTRYGWHTGWARLDFSRLAPGTTANVRLAVSLGNLVLYDAGLAVITSGFGWAPIGGPQFISDVALDPGVYYVELMWFDWEPAIFGGTATVDLTITSDTQGVPGP